MQSAKEKKQAVQKMDTKGIEKSRNGEGEKVS